MKQLIDKSTLVAEIERRIKGLQDCHADTVEGYAGEISGLKRLLSLLDTLEVKDVDLEKEFESFLDNIEGVPRMWHSDEQIEWGKDIAKHFFELGLKAQKVEKL